MFEKPAFRKHSISRKKTISGSVCPSPVSEMQPASSVTIPFLISSLALTASRNFFRNKINILRINVRQVKDVAQVAEQVINIVRVVVGKAPSPRVRVKTVLSWLSANNQGPAAVRISSCNDMQRPGAYAPSTVKLASAPSPIIVKRRAFRLSADVLACTLCIPTCRPSGKGCWDQPARQGGSGERALGAVHDYPRSHIMTSLMRSSNVLFPLIKKV